MSLYRRREFALRIRPLFLYHGRLIRKNQRRRAPHHIQELSVAPNTNTAHEWMREEEVTFSLADLE